MTEKRFTHKKWYDNRQLFDGDEPFAIVDVYIQAKYICDKLNELNDENRYLNQEMGDLGTAHAEEINKIEDEFDEEILKLEKKNEQLKKICNNLIMKNQQLKMEIMRLEMIIKTGEKKDEHIGWKRVDVE